MALSKTAATSELPKPWSSHLWATQTATSELPKQPPLSKTAATSELPKQPPLSRPKQPPLSYSSSHLWATQAATSEQNCSHLWATQPQCQHRHETCMAFRLCRWALHWTQISANTTKLSPSGSTVMPELVKVGKAHSSGAGLSYSGATCTSCASRAEFWASSFCSDIKSSTWWCEWCVCELNSNHTQWVCRPRYMYLLRSWCMARELAKLDILYASPSKLDILYASSSKHICDLFDLQ